jgi:DNA-binding transcriptional ArsR family regulator
MVTHSPAAASGRTGAVFHAVADPTRRAILDQLRAGERTVKEIAGHFAVSRPAISKHLRVLHQADLVREHRHGRHRVYRLSPKPLREVDRWLAEYRALWTANLSQLKKHLESPTA